MPKQEIKAGQTDYTVLVYIPDSASTDGSGKTGLVAANLTVSYVRVETDNDVTVTDVTSSLNNLAALTTAHTDWGLLEVSSTLAPGLYRLDIADAVFASGAWSAVVYVMVTTSAAVASPMEFVMVPSEPLTGVQLAGTQPALTLDSVNVLNAFQVQGLTTFHNGVLIGNDSGYGLTITGSSGAISASSVTFSGTFAVADTVTFSKGLAANITGNITGNLSGSAGSVTGNVGGNVAGSVASVVAITTSGGKVSGVILVDTLTTYTGNTPQTGDSFSRIGATGSGLTSLAQASVWTSTRGGYIDNLSGGAVALAATALTSATWTNARAAYLDNLSGGAVMLASSYSAPPSAAAIRAEIDSNSVGLAAIYGRTDVATSTRAAASALATAQTTLTRLETTWALDGSVYQFTSNALELAPSGGGGGSAPTVEEIDAYLSAEHGSGSWESGGTGSGARSVTVTVNDGATALESARVRFTKGAESYVGSTNASGVATFSLDDGTWTVTISLAGYTFTPTTLIVNGTETATYSMTAVNVAPSDPPFITGYFVCYDESGDVAPGVVVNLRLVAPPAGYGLALNSSTRTATSGGDGVAEFAGLIPGGTYSAWKNGATPKRFVIPSGATDPYALPDIMGAA